jgi:hypothetical protein
VTMGIWASPGHPKRSLRPVSGDVWAHLLSFRSADVGVALRCSMHPICRESAYRPVTRMRNYAADLRWSSALLVRRCARRLASALLSAMALFKPASLRRCSFSAVCVVVFTRPAPLSVAKAPGSARHASCPVIASSQRRADRGIAALVLGFRLSGNGRSHGLVPASPGRRGTGIPC